MAKSEFKLGDVRKLTNEKAVEAAKVKDARNANFHIPAEKDAILTLTGEIYEQDWTRGTDSGTMLLAGVKELVSPIPFGFFRTKKLLQEDGLKEFSACFPKDASFEDIIKGIKKDKKVKVQRSDYVYPGRSSSRDIDTLIWVE